LPDDPRFGEPAGGALEGALYFPDGGYVTDPQLAARNLQRAAEAHGAAFRFNANVTAVRVEHGRAAGVELSGGETVAAPVVVNAAGPYSAIVNRMAGVLGGMAIRTRPLRQEVCHVERPKELGLEGPLAGETALVVLDADTGGYFRTEHDHALLIGGMEPDCDPRVWVDDPDTFERGPSELWQAQVMRQALRLPGLGIPGQARGVADLYDVSDDWVPIYDKSDVPGFYMAVGTSGNQFKNGPVAGQMMAGLIDACERGLDHDASPYRFALAHTGLTLDCAAFSRRRAVTADSTMSVLG
jgi:sarcosine oxidase subunit beta